MEENNRYLQVHAARVEARQRAAELAVIHTLQQSLSSAPGFQAIVDAVGDKLREVFPDSSIGIRIYAPQTGCAGPPCSENVEMDASQ